MIGKVNSSLSCSFSERTRRDPKTSNTNESLNSQFTLRITSPPASSSGGRTQKTVHNPDYFS